MAPLDLKDVFAELSDFGERLRPFVTVTEPIVSDALKAGQRVIVECAQGAMLDIDYGTYPYVTSSATTAAGACQGAGIPPMSVDRVLGVFKAYSTRVGAGPLPTELLDATGELIRQRGREYGTTTGRPRRTGWFDAVAARYVAQLSGVSEIALTLLDVLDAFESIDVCVAYELDGEIIESLPARLDELMRAKPIYERLEGWKQSTTAARRPDELPDQAAGYLRFLERQIGVPIRLVGVGPAREQIVPFAPSAGQLVSA
jgi:adenylosuccinate synthase